MARNLNTQRDIDYMCINKNESIATIRLKNELLSRCL